MLTQFITIDQTNNIRISKSRKKKCTNDICPEKTQTNQSKQFVELLKKVLNELFILEKMATDLLTKVNSVNSQTAYNVIIDADPKFITHIP